MSYDGSLKFDTKIDTEEFAEGLKKIQEIAKSGMSKVETATDNATKAIQESTEQIEKNKAQSEKWQSGLNDVKSVLGKTENKLKDNTTAFDKLSKETQNADKKTNSFGDEVKSTEKELTVFNDTSNDTTEGVKRLGDASSKAKRKLELLKTAANKVGDGFTSIVRTAGNAISTLAKATVTGVGVVSAGALTIGTAATRAGIEFESAFAGVEKTVDATDEQLSKLRQGLLDMSKEIPQSAADLSAIAESAGQLGIETDNIEKFTQVMANLGVATNMTSDEAATSLARFANITGMPQKNFDRLGSTIVALGNNLATTESEIVDMSLRIAGAGKQVGMSESQIMSFSAALSSVGIEAEMGGSAFSTLLSKIQLATDKGGEDLDKFAKVAGVSGGEFKKLFQKDATEAVSAFLKGLNKINENGGSVISTLDDMDLSEVRMRDTLLRASSASDVFTKAMSTGTEAWKENNALTKEANKRYETLESKIQLMKNGIQNLGIAFKDSIDTELRGAVQLGTDYINRLSEAFTKGGLQGAVETAGNIFGEISTKIAQYAPKMIDSAFQFIDSFVNGIKNNSSKLLASGEKIVQSVIDGIINFTGYTSDLIDGAVAIIQGLITAISSNESKLLQAGESIIDSIVNGIVSLAENAETITKGVVALIKSFVESVKRNKDKLLSAAKEIVRVIADGLVNLLPQNVQSPVKKCINAIIKLFNSNALKKAIQSARSFIEKLAETIANLAGSVIPKCTKVLEFLIDNFDTIVPLVFTTITAIKAYRTAVIIAEMAQAGFNATMSANPIGLVITLIGTLVGGLITLHSWLNKTSDKDKELQKSQKELEEAEKNLDVANENLANSISKIKSSMDEFEESIDSAKSSMENFDDSLIIPESTKQQLEKDMSDTQEKINKIVYNASGERKKLTDNEIEALENLIKKQLELANRNLKLTTLYQNSSNEKTDVFAKNFNGSAKEFAEQSKSYLKGAEESYEKVVDAAEEKLNQEIANLQNLRGTEAKYNAEWYESESKKSYESYEKEIELAKKRKGETYSIISDSYSKRVNLFNSFSKATENYNNKLNKAEEYKKQKTEEYQKWYNKKYSELNTSSVKFEKNLLELNTEYSEKINNAKKEYTEQIENAEKGLTDFLEGESAEQIGIFLDLVKKSSESGKKISDDAALMVYNLRKSLKNLPDDVKEKMGDVYDKMVSSLDNLPDKIYEQGEAAAEALKKTTGKDLSDSMFNNGKNSVTSLENGILSKIPGLSPVANIVADTIKKSTGKDLSNDMYVNGKNTVIGLINGVLSQLPGLSYVANVIASVFSSTYQNYNKINSPSKLMCSLGQYTVEGLEIGLKDRTKKLAETAKSLAESVSGTMSDGLNSGIVLDTNAEMTAKLKAAVSAQVNDIGVSMTSRNADNGGSQANENNSVKASGNITTHISIDGREFAVATVPYIDEELAFVKG